MTSIKDKLASSVRQAKTTAESAPADKAETNKTPRSTSAASTKASAEPADSLAAEPPPSVQELFPDRIWPD
jgi:hypothetical protein